MGLTFNLLNDKNSTFKVAHERTKKRLRGKNSLICNIVSLKVQFICFLIGQRLTGTGAQSVVFTALPWKRDEFVIKHLLTSQTQCSLFKAHAYVSKFSLLIFDVLDASDVA